MALNILRLDAKLGEMCFFSPHILVRGHFHEIGIAAVPLGLKPRHVEKFRERRMTDVGESELGLTDEKEETCANHKIAFAERAI